MNVIIANSVGRIREGSYVCPFPSRWTSIVKDYPIFTFYPYELGYLSTFLKAELEGAHVELIDGTYLRFTPDEYIRFLRFKKPDWLVFELDTVTYAANIQVALALKKEFGTKIIIAGQYPTAFPDKCLKDGADYACIGEYELAVLDILKGETHENIKGIFPNGPRPPMDINRLPFPEDDDIKRIDYSYPGGCRWTKYREIEFHASRGCPYRCSFCVAGTVYYERPNWRVRPTEDIIKEILHLKDKYPRLEGFFFNEETHIIDKKKTLALCKAIEHAGLNDLHYEAMANYTSLDEEIISTLASAGYYKLRIGIETLDEEVGENIGVKVDEVKLTNVLKSAKANGLEIYASFLLGAPGSTRKKDEKTMRIGRKLIEQGLIQSFQASIAVPHAGTPFYQKAEKNGWFRTSNPESFSGIHYSAVEYPDYPGKEIESMMVKLHEEFGEAGQKTDSNPRSRSVAGNKIAMSLEEKQIAHEKLQELAHVEKCSPNGKALDLGKNLVRSFPHYLMGQSKLGELFVKRDKHSEAKDCFNTVIELAQDYDDAIRYGANAHFHIGLIELLSGNYDDGLNHITKCTYLDPKNKTAREYFWALAEHRNPLPEKIIKDLKTSK